MNHLSDNTTTLLEGRAPADALRQQVLQANATLKAAHETYQEADRLARGIRWNTEAPAHAALEQLKTTYSARALELAIEANKCPRARWGGHMDPDEVYVRAEGICMTWDINGNYAPEWYLASWADLLQTPAVDGEGSTQ